MPSPQSARSTWPLSSLRPLLPCSGRAPGAAPGGRGGGRGGPPGGGPEVGMNTRPPNAPDQKPAVASRTRAPEQKLNVAFDVVTVTEGLQPVGPGVPSRREDARHREAGTAARGQRRRQDDVGAGRRPACGGLAWSGRAARRLARSGVPEESADLLELGPSRARR